MTDANLATGISYSKLSGAPTSLPPGGAAGGDLSGTYPNPTVANSAITSAKILNGTISDTDISGTAAIATSKISGLGTLATLTPTGTASATTFLRGDNTWAAAGGGTGNIFLNNATINAANPSYLPVGGGGNSGVQNVIAVTMPAACTFRDFYVFATPTGGTVSADTVTITLFKNGAATPVTVTFVTSATLNTTVAAGDTTNTVAVAAGDTVVFQAAQSTTAPVIRVAYAIRCQ